MNFFSRLDRENRRSLANWPVIALKAGLAVVMTRQMCLIFGIEDFVSGVFVSVAAISPGILSGIRRSASQLVGSVIGGSLAILALSILPSQGAALGLAVAGSLLVTGPFLQNEAPLVAAFTALFIVIMSHGNSAVTAQHRLASVLAGSLMALVVNFAGSALLYRRLFRRRIDVCEAVLTRLLRGSDDLEHDGFFCETLLRNLERELGDAFRDSWLVSRTTTLKLVFYRDEAEALLSVLSNARSLYLRKGENCRKELLNAAQLLSGRAARIQAKTPLLAAVKTRIELAQYDAESRAG